MRYLLNAKEAGWLDRISIDEYGIPSLVLMERAALSFAYRIKENFSKDEKFLILCGMGNNGGDGVAAGRILMEWGYDVSVFLIGKEEKASSEMKTQLNIARKCHMHFLEQFDLTEYTVLVDAIFGIGLSREIRGDFADYIHKMNESGLKIVSVDIPSGVSASTGEILGIAVQADITVTFGENKLGLVLFPGTKQAGKVYVEGIGFPKDALKKVSPVVFHYEKKDIPMKFPKRKPDSHKGSYGKLLVIAGSENISGAAFFAAKAAYLAGCGLVKVITHENNRQMIQEKLPEALLSVYGEKEPELGKEISWATAVLLGPGLGIEKQSAALLEQVLEIRDKPVLLDADGLNLLCGYTDYVKEGKISLPDNFVLTPHLLEMSRLTGDSVDQIKTNLLSYGSRMTNGAVLVLKDSHSLVFGEDGIYVNTSGNHALAKGGSGDVLSGVIAGLLARGENIFSAAAIGVYLHGLTAEEYNKENSSSSMLASDILDMLKKVLP